MIGLKSDALEWLILQLRFFFYENHTGPNYRHQNIQCHHNLLNSYLGKVKRKLEL